MSREMSHWVRLPDGCSWIAAAVRTGRQLRSLPTLQWPWWQAARQAPDADAHMDVDCPMSQRKSCAAVALNMLCASRLRRGTEHQQRL